MNMNESPPLTNLGLHDGTESWKCWVVVVVRPLLARQVIGDLGGQQDFTQVNLEGEELITAAVSYKA